MDFITLSTVYSPLSIALARASAYQVRLRADGDLDVAYDEARRMAAVHKSASVVQLHVCQLLAVNLMICLIRVGMRSCAFGVLFFLPNSSEHLESLLDLSMWNLWKRSLTGTTHEADLGVLISSVHSSAFWGQFRTACWAEGQAVEKWNS